MRRRSDLNADLLVLHVGTYAPCLPSISTKHGKGTDAAAAQVDARLHGRAHHRVPIDIAADQSHVRGAVELQTVQVVALNAAPVDVDLVRVGTKVQTILRLRSNEEPARHFNRV